MVRCARLPVQVPENTGLWLFSRTFMFLAFDPAVSPHHEVFSLPSGHTDTLDLEYTKIAMGGEQQKPEDKGNLGPYDLKLRKLWEPRVPWKPVENKKTLVSLFEPCKMEEFIYGEEDEEDGDSDGNEEDIHEADDFDGITSDVGDDGDDTGDAHEDEDGEFISEDGSEVSSEDFPINLDKDDKFKREVGFKYSWDSDEDNFIDPEESAAYLEEEEKPQHVYMILGLHPHKDVVLLFNRFFSNVVAYHFKTLRMQHLGLQLVRGRCGVHGAFPYRPCYVDALPSTKMPCQGWCCSGV
ncbi:hypothetical protein ZWY2020_029522 [Hordeum vulgare]|nr:hypothetical protein ZWY2020_029522 [Hordeum vulgare]